MLTRRALFAALALVSTTGVAASTQAAPIVLTPPQIQNLVRQCTDRLTATPQTFHVKLMNLGQTLVDSEITAVASCDNVPVLNAGGFPSNRFLMRFSRTLGGTATVTDQISYEPTADPSRPTVDISVAGECIGPSVEIYRARLQAAGINPDLYIETYTKVAKHNCEAVRDAIVVCARDKGGQGC